jgi:hypothetical protein
MSQHTFRIDMGINPFEPIDILATLQSGVFESNLSCLPPNPLTIIIAIVLKDYIVRACGSKNVVFRLCCFN